MRLSSLLSPLDIRPERDVEIRGVTEDSRRVEPGYLFFAYRGTASDGNLYVKEALKKGAAALFTDSPVTYKLFSGKLPVFLTRSPRRDLAVLSARFFGNPERELSLLGVTGTNGKTTTAYLLFHGLNRLGEAAGIVGTVEWGTENCRFPSDRTTPSPTVFFKQLAFLKERGVRWVACEVSSHGLELERLYGVKFKGTIFTNLTPEHLDFHKTMFDYFAAKEKLFFSSDVSLFNIDDRWGELLYYLRPLFKKVATYGTGGEFRIEGFGTGNFVPVSYGGKSYRIETSLKGFFNFYNVTAAFSLLTLLGFPPEELQTVFRGVKVPGRLEEVAPGVFVDYAHTPDALKKVLEALKPLTKGKLTVVFGCGGDRDREKRAPMGKIASHLADKVIVTTDNPRNEPPELIIEDILSGIEEREKVEVIPDRREAIEEALRKKGEGDVVLIAGKGHETYQQFKDRTVYFSDREVVEEFYGRKGDS